MTKPNNRIEAFELVDRAMRLQLADDNGDLDEVEDCLNKAIELDPENIHALQEAAHFYESVVPNAEKARKYAATCRRKAATIISEMDGILGRPI
jgi:Tfp pilus assembly protein PilF